MTFILYKNQIIGTGCNGTVVYTGLYMGKLVAIKRIKKLYLDTDIIYREVELMKSISHQNLLQLYYYEENHKYIYLIMEKCILSIRELIE